MGIHVAILLRPYIQMILEGRKTVESRLTRTSRVPYKAIEPGERIWFKASAGPFMCQAVARDVTFYEDLSPRLIERLMREWNNRVCGEPTYWHMKRNSRYATFITLDDVQRAAVGPKLAPSRGPAWFVLDEDLAPTSNGHDVVLTEGALRNCYVSIAEISQLFPDDAIGGDRVDDAAKPVRLILPDGSYIDSDIVGSKKIFRSRAWRKWFSQPTIEPDDVVRFEPIGRRRYRVHFVKASDAEMTCPS